MHKRSVQTNWKNPMSIGTRCHQLAMFAVYDSPLQIFSGNHQPGIEKNPNSCSCLEAFQRRGMKQKFCRKGWRIYYSPQEKKADDWFIAGLNKAAMQELFHWTLILLKKQNLI